MPAVMAFLPPTAAVAGSSGGRTKPNLFSSPSPAPLFNDPLPPFPSPPPLPPRPHRRRHKPINNTHPNTSSQQEQEEEVENPAFRLPHRRTNYQKPVSPGAVLAADPSDAASGRAVVVGQSGVSFRLPGAPFDFQFSYSEKPKAAPIAIREPAFLPFAPPSMPRPWTGKAPLLSKKEKARKKGVRLFRPLGQEEEEEEEEVSEQGLVMETRGKRMLDMAIGCTRDGRSRDEVLGKPLSHEEKRQLIKLHLSHNRQLNIGKRRNKKVAC